MSKQTTICVSPETLSTWQELSARTRIPISELVKEITENIQKMLDLQEANRKLLFMSDFSPENRHIVHVRVSDAMQFGSLGSLNLPKEIKKQLQAQTDIENAQLKGEKA